MLGIARGLQYLHNFNPVVVHGDLRAVRNLMAFFSGSGVLIYMIHRGMS